jgi:hypothetical protein
MAWVEMCDLSPPHSPPRLLVPTLTCSRQPLNRKVSRLPLGGERTCVVIASLYTPGSVLARLDLVGSDVDRDGKIAGRIPDRNPDQRIATCRKLAGSRKGNFALRGGSARPSSSACMSRARWLARLRTFSFMKGSLWLASTPGTPHHERRQRHEGRGRLTARYLSGGPRSRRFAPHQTAAQGGLRSATGHHAVNVSWPSVRKSIQAHRDIFKKVKKVQKKISDAPISCQHQIPMP